MVEPLRMNMDFSFTPLTLLQRSLTTIQDINRLTWIFGPIQTNMQYAKLTLFILDSTLNFFQASYYYFYTLSVDRIDRMFAISDIERGVSMFVLVATSSQRMLLISNREDSQFGRVYGEIVNSGGSLVKTTKYRSSAVMTFVI